MYFLRSTYLITCLWVFTPSVVGDIHDANFPDYRFSNWDMLQIILNGEDSHDRTSVHTSSGHAQIPGSEDDFQDNHEEHHKATNWEEEIFHQRREFLRAFEARFPTSGDLVEFLQTVFKETDSDINPLCVEDLGHFVQGVLKGKFWAVKMVDAWGKLPAGFLNVYSILRGDYQECQKVVASNRPPKPGPTASPSTSSTTSSSSSLTPSTSASAGTTTTTGSSSTGVSHNTTVLVSSASSLYHERANPSREYSAANPKFNYVMVRENQHGVNNGNVAERSRMLRQVKAKDDDVMFRGKFCRVGISSYALVPGHKISISTWGMYLGLSMDICVPDSCKAEDITLILNRTVDAILFHSNPGEIAIEQSTCLEKQPYESKTIAMIIFIVVGLLIEILCTIYDVVYIQKPKWKLQKMRREFLIKKSVLEQEVAKRLAGDGTVASPDNERTALLQVQQNRLAARGGVREEDLAVASPAANSYGESLEDWSLESPRLSTLQVAIQCGSMYTNGSKLMNTDLAENTITCMHGIRFISMAWIIFGHTFLNGVIVVENALAFYQKETHRIYSLILGNAFLVVDTFFVISGTMVGYLFQSIADIDSRFTWLVYILHRFFRLTPTVAITGALYLGLWPHLGSGPNYPAAAPEEEPCREYWAYTLFYINNFVKTEHICLSYTWYLSNDYQFYLLAPIIMIPLVRGWRKTGIFMASLFIVTTIVTSGIISYKYTLPENVIQVETADGGVQDVDIYFQKLYLKPYCRMAPYVVGLVVGFILKRTNLKLKLPRYVVMLGWLCSTVTALAVVFGIYPSYSRTQLMTVAQAAVYNAFKHTAFGLSIGWVIFACGTGNGGIVNYILSWKVFIPLSRVTFSTYLVHTGIIYLFSFSLDNVIWMNEWSLIVHFLGILFISTALGFFISITVEAVSIRIEKKILERLGFDF